MLTRLSARSQDRGSNPGPHPYHGCALPTELSWHLLVLQDGITVVVKFQTDGFCGYVS
jgi:hypothetical protein